MLRKEFIESAKAYFEVSLIYVAFLFTYLFDKLFLKYGFDFRSLFFYFFMAIAIIYPVYAGLTIFGSEKKENALEYFLSLPISRLKKIALKVFPRFMIVFFHILVILLLSPSHFSSSAVWLVFLLFLSIFLSLVIRSILIGFIAVYLLFSTFSMSTKIIMYLIKNFSALNSLESFPLFSSIVAALVILAPLGVAFWWTFKKLDMKPMKLQIYPYYYVVFPAIIIHSVLILLIYSDFIAWPLSP